MRMVRRVRSGITSRGLLRNHETKTGGTFGKNPFEGEEASVRERSMKLFA